MSETYIINFASYFKSPYFEEPSVTADRITFYSQDFNEKPN